MKITGTLLEATAKEFKNEKGEVIPYNFVIVRIDGKMAKFKGVSGLKVSPSLVDLEVELSLELRVAADMSASVRVTEVSKA